MPGDIIDVSGVGQEPVAKEIFEGSAIQQLFRQLGASISACQRQLRAQASRECSAGRAGFGSIDALYDRYQPLGFGDPVGRFNSADLAGFEPFEQFAAVRGALTRAKSIDGAGTVREFWARLLKVLSSIFKKELEAARPQGLRFSGMNDRRTVQGAIAAKTASNTDRSLLNLPFVSRGTR